MMSSQSSGGGGPIVLDLEFGTTIVKNKNGIDDDDDDVVNDEEFDNGDYNYNVNFDSSFDSDDEDTDVDVDVDMTDNIIDDGGDNVFHSSDVDALVEEEEEEDSNIQAKITHKSHTNHSADKSNNDNDGVDDDDDDSSIAIVKSSELWNTILSSQNYHSAPRASSSSSSSSSSPDHHNTNNEHVGVVPTLRRIAGMTIASNLEHIPPGVIGVALSESHWDTIVKYRHDFWGGSGSSSSVISNNTRAVKQQQQQQQQQQQHCHRIQQLALSENILIAIEQHPNNTHIAQSHSADVYFWRDIVNKVYPNMGGIYRPIILSYPITFVQDKLVQLGHELLELLTVPLVLLLEMTKRILRKVPCKPPSRRRLNNRIGPLCFLHVPT
jgi:hypothetical protein